MITTTKSHTRTLITVAIAAIGALSAARALRPSWEAPTPTEANLAEERLQDFRDATYFPIREFLAGGNPYDPAAMFEHWPVRQNFNLYQPYHLVLHLPFALPDYRIGAIAFTLASLVLLAVLGLLAARQAKLPLVLGTVAIAALLVTSQVGKAQLYVGQVNPLIAVGAAAALLGSSHPRVAALGLAVAWLKPQFGLPLAVLLFARGSRRVSLGGTAIAALASLPVVGLLVYRSGGVGAFLDVIDANLAHASQTTYGAVDSFTSQRVDLPAVFFRVTGWLPPAAELIALVGVLAATALLARKLDRGDEDSRSVADLLTGAGAVVALVHQPGDVLIAVPAMAAVAVVCWRRRKEQDWRITGLAVAALAVPFVHLYFVNSAVVGLFGSRVDVTVDGVAIVAAWALLVVVAARKRA
ncbi:glycosyltransferase family 87 protein [Lentzea terrae]|uniref:glycosyltransferase family 87 protein n=1 Tax=Lentzea terrae TaxID=2200761 RepID=UPI0018E50195|nr:glycosyltransferase family 87 protein [Lentzea terrae]